MKKTIDFIIYGNLFIGLGAYCLTEFIMKAFELKIPHSQNLSLFLFFSTCFTYNFHRRMGHALHPHSINSAATHWMLKNPKTSKLISIASFILAVIFLIDLPKASVYILLPISLISLLYVQRLSEEKVLREIPFLKIFLIAAVWTAAVLFLPAIVAEEHSAKIFLFSIGFLLFMVAEIIPFDIRDMRNDQLENLKTIPSILDIKKSKQLAIGLLAVSNCLLIPTLWVYSNWLYGLIIFMTSIYLGVCILYVNKKRSDYFYTLLIESSFIFPWILSNLIGFLWL